MALWGSPRLTAIFAGNGRLDNMMTIRRLSVAAGYKYLLKSIAVSDDPAAVDTSDLVHYYSETGTPPGVFLGAGSSDLPAVGVSRSARR